MNCALWVLILLLAISAKKQLQQLHQRRPLGTAVKQQPQVKQQVDEKVAIGAKITAGIKQGEQLEQKIQTLQQQLNEAKKQQAKLKEEQLRIEKQKAAAEAKAKATAPRVLIKQPILPKNELEKPINTLRCARNRNYFCIVETTCCPTVAEEWGYCPKPDASHPNDCSALVVGEWGCCPVPGVSAVHWMV